MNGPNADLAVTAADAVHKRLSPADDVIPEGCSIAINFTVDFGAGTTGGEGLRPILHSPCDKSEPILQPARPDYSPAAKLEAIVVDDSGHSVQLHENAGHTTSTILDRLFRCRAAQPVTCDRLGGTLFPNGPGGAVRPGRPSFRERLRTVPD